MHKVNLRNVLQFLLSINQSGFHISRKVDLAGIPVDNHLGIKTKTGQKHLHLHDGGILRFIENDKGIVQGPPPHIGQRRYLDNLALHHPSCLVLPQDLVKSIIDRTEIRVYFFFEISWKETKALSGFYSWTSQNNALDLTTLEGGHGQGHR